MLGRLCYTSQMVVEHRDGRHWSSNVRTEQANTEYVDLVVESDKWATEV
jgi:hypothetical protein